MSLRIGAFIALIFSTSLTHSDEAPLENLTSEGFSVSIEDSLYSVLPSKSIQTTAYKDIFIISSRQTLVVSHQFETNANYVFSLTAYDDNDLPIALDDDSLTIEFKGLFLEFDFRKYFENQATTHITLMLDDSDSMAGKRTNELLEGLRDFAETTKSKQMYCRVMWFSSTFEYEWEEWEDCYSSIYRSRINTRNEYKGTNLLSPLKNAIVDLNASYLNTTNKTIVIFTDGKDRSSMLDTYAIEKAIEIEKYSTNTRIYSYVLSVDGEDFADSYVRRLSDYVYYSEDERASKLSDYLSVVSNRLEHENIITIDKYLVDAIRDL